MRDKYQIVLVDDHKVIHSAIKMYFLGDDQFELLNCLEEFHLKELKVLEGQSSPVLLLDINLKNNSGLDKLKDIKSIHPSIKVIIFSANDQGFFRQTALENGADGFFSKSDDLEGLKEYIAQVSSGQQGISVQETEIGAIYQLSKKEKVVFTELYKGKTYKEIAAMLNVSIKTIEAHQSSIFKKLGLSSRVELIHFAQKSGYKADF